MYQYWVLQVADSFNAFSTWSSPLRQCLTGSALDHLRPSFKCQWFWTNPPIVNRHLGEWRKVGHQGLQVWFHCQYLERFHVILNFHHDDMSNLATKQHERYITYSTLTCLWYLWKSLKTESSGPSSTLHNQVLNPQSPLGPASCLWLTRFTPLLRPEQSQSFLQMDG